MAQHPAKFSDGKSLVLEAVDLVRLVGETVQLKRAGRRFVGLCPFHSEKTPSFGVDPQKQAFYCFGCKKGGNAIDFVIERDRVGFKNALETLAEWAGVELPKLNRSPEQTDKRKRLVDAHSEVTSLYHRLLGGPEGKTALAYLRNRGFSDETITRFGIGYAPAGWENLAGHGLLRKYPAPLLEEAGLLKRRERGDGFYDTFRDRVIFPIRDEQGRPIAFGGRVLPGGESPAKYLNSPETPLFSKSRVLFGLDLAKKRIVETRTAVVFEGYADAAMAHQFGVTNGVAVLGTALTPDHAQTLRRFADRIVLLFDADAAGGIATQRSVELFLREPVEIAVAQLPEGKDPDEFLQANGIEAFEQVISGAQDALSFAWRAMQREFDAEKSVTAAQNALGRFLDTVAKARDATGAIDPQRWGAILLRLQKTTGLRAQDLNQRFQGPPPRHASAPAQARPFQNHRSDNTRREWKASRGRWSEPRYTGPRRRDLAAVSTASAEMRMEAHLLGALFNDPHLWHHVQAHVGPDDFTDRRHRWLAEAFWEVLRNEGEPSFAEWLEYVTTATGDRPGAAANAKAACIELAELASEVAGKESEASDMRPIAAAATEFFLKRRGGRQLEQLLAEARQRSSADDTSAGSAEADDDRLLRLLEEKLRESGRA